MLVDCRPAKRPERTKLIGHFISLEPLDPSIHGEELYNGTHGETKEQLWSYLPWGPFADRASFDVHLQQLADSSDPLFFAVIDNTTKKTVGHAAYLRIEPQHRVIEVGSILFIPSFQRTIGSTEAMYLMAKYAFEALGYRRYEWKCNTANSPSRTSALRLGFTFEGIFRQHYIFKGRNRDTAWYSMLDHEWPERKTAFEHWLDPSNFDGNGKQKAALKRT
jgi:RimJ/RimL family protein N-acetyltransferase